MGEKYYRQNYDSITKKNNNENNYPNEDITNKLLNQYSVTNTNDYLEEEEEEVGLLPKITDTIIDIPTSLLQGLTKGLEGIVDAGAGVAGGIGKMFGADDEWAREFISRDLTHDVYGTSLDDLTKDSYLNDGKVGNIINSALEGVGGMLPSIALNAATGGGGLLLMATQAGGNSMEEAFNLNPDINYKQAFAYGLLSGATEAATEKISDVFGWFGGKGLTDKLVSRVAKTTGGKVLFGLVGEGAEEVISDLVNPYWQRLTNVDKNASTPTLEQLGETFIVGALTSAFMQGPAMLRAGGVKNYLSIKNAEILNQKNSDILEQAKIILKDNMSAEEYAKLQADNNAFNQKILTVIDEYNNGTLSDKELDTLIEQREKIKTELDNRLQAYEPKIREKFGEKVYSKNILTREITTNEDLFQSGFDNPMDVKNIKSEINKNVIVKENLKQDENYKYAPISKADIKRYTPIQIRAMNSSQELVEKINQKYNKNLKVVFTEKNTKINGAYSDGVIYVNPTAQNPLRVVAMHEYTHSLEGTQEYEELKKELSKNEDFNERVNKLKEKYSKVNQGDLQTAQEEYVANYISEKLFGDYKDVLSITKDSPKTSSKALKWINEKINSLGKTKAEMELKDKLEKQKKLFERALEKNTEETVKNNLKEVDTNIAEVDSSVIKLSLRTKEAPETTRIGFKMFDVDEKGNPHALFIDSENSLEVGLWYDADAPSLDGLIKYSNYIEKQGISKYGYYIIHNNNSIQKIEKLPTISKLKEETLKGGRHMSIEDKPSGDRYYTIGINGSNTISKYSYRPGWHLTNAPANNQIGSAKNLSSNNKGFRRPNQRWFLVEYNATKDYSKEASKEKNGLQYLPENGWYSFKTNSNASNLQNWIITDSIKLIAPLTREQIYSISDKYGFDRDLEMMPNTKLTYKEEDAIDNKQLKEYLNRYESENGNVKFDSNKTKYSIKDIQDNLGGEIVNGKLAFDQKKVDAFVNEAANNIYKVELKHTKLGEFESLETIKTRVRKYIDDIAGSADIMRLAGLNADYTDARSALKTNGDYVITIDLSTLCPKRIQLNIIWDKITELQQKGLLKHNDILSNPNAYFKLIEIMQEEGLMTPCAYCFVESRRKLIGEMTDNFLKCKNLKDIQEDLSNTYQKYANMSEEELDSLSKEEKAIFNKAKKLKAHKEILEFEKQEGRTLESADLMNSERLEDIYNNYPELYKAYNSFYGAVKPKLVERATEFTFGTLKNYFIDKKGNINQARVDKINEHGGLRLLSYSDFQIEHAIDFMQTLLEASELGLKIQAYTKIPEFARLMAGSGVKLNLSIGLIKTKNGWEFTSKDGMDINEAKKLRKLSNDIGTILVSPNVETSLKYMGEEYIDYFIPFHRSSIAMTKKKSEEMSEAQRLGLDGYRDSTNYQNEKQGVQGTKKAKTNISQSEYWDYSVPGNENSKNYIKKCVDLDIKPKFADIYLHNSKRNIDTLTPTKSAGKSILYKDYLDKNNIKYEEFNYKGYDFIIPDGYWKCLGDYRNYGNDGKAAPQKPVTTNIDFNKINEMFKNSYDSRLKLANNKFVSSEEINKKIERVVNKFKEYSIEDLKHSLKFNDNSKMKMSLKDLESKKQGLLFNDNTNKIKASIDSKKFYEFEKGDSLYLNYVDSPNTKRVYKGLAPTITTKNGDYAYVDSKGEIRRFTNLERWELMGFNEEQFKKVENVVGKTALQEQAGNSIVVNVLEAMIPNLNLNKKVKLSEYFAGIGAIRQALLNLGYKVNSQEVVEIDNDAVKSYNALYDENIKPSSIVGYSKTIKSPIDVDILLHGSPCQSNSFLNNSSQKGMEKGSGAKSSLLWESVEAIKVNKPKIVIWENVASAKTMKGFQEYLQIMQSIGYTNSIDILNAKDYGVPQSRERIFVVSQLDGKEYVFPKKTNNTLPLMDFLENDGTKYWISEDVDAYIDHEMSVNEKEYKKEYSKSYIESILVDESMVEDYIEEYGENWQKKVYDSYDIWEESELIREEILSKLDKDFDRVYEKLSKDLKQIVKDNPDLSIDLNSTKSMNAGRFPSQYFTFTIDGYDEYDYSFTLRYSDGHENGHLSNSDHSFIKMLDDYDYKSELREIKEELDDWYYETTNGQLKFSLQENNDEISDITSRNLTVIEANKEQMDFIDNTIGSSLILSRDTITNPNFMKTMNSDIQKNVQLAFKKALEGTNRKTDKKVSFNNKKVVFNQNGYQFTEYDLQRIFELGQRKSQPTSQYDQILLGNWYKATGNITVEKHSGVNIKILKEDCLPTYLQEALNKAKAFNRELKFYTGQAYRQGVLGWYNIITKKMFIGIDNGYSTLGIVNHELNHSFMQHSPETYRKGMKFMKDVKKILVENGDFRNFMNDMKQSYPNLILEPTSARNRLPESFDFHRNSVLEEGCCDIIGGNYETTIQELKDLREKFLEENKKFFIFEGLEKTIKRNTLRPYIPNPIEVQSNVVNTQNQVATRIETNETKLNEKIKKNGVDFKIQFTNAQAGITDAIFQMTKDRKKVAEMENICTIARASGSASSSALQNGIFLKDSDGKLYKASKSWDECFDFLNEKFDKDLNPTEYNKYKQEYFNYLLHQHNVDRMSTYGMLNFKEINSIGLTEQGETELKNYFEEINKDNLKKKIKVIQYTKSLDKLFSNINDAQLVEAYCTEYRQVFSRHIMLENMMEQDVTTLKELAPKVYEKLTSEKQVNEYDIPNLIDELNTNAKKVVTKILEKNLTNVSSEDSKKNIVEIEKIYPEFKEHAEDVWQYNDILLEYQYQEGLINEEQRDFVRERYPHYVPTYRVTNPNIPSTSKKTDSSLEIRNGLGYAKGSDLAILPIDVSMARKTRSVFKAARINNVAKILVQTYNESQAENKNNYVEKIETREKKIYSVEDIDYEEINTLEPTSETNNVITYYDNGKQMDIKVNRQIHEGFVAMDSSAKITSSNIVVSVLSKFKTVFQKLVTEWNPFFMVRNFARDIQDALLYSRYGSLGVLKNLPKAYKGIISNSDMWQQYISMGGLYSTIFDWNNGTVDNKQISKTRKKIKNKTKSIRKIGQAISRANMIVEQATRFAEYLNALDNGSTVEEAFAAAQEITVNFGRGGKLTKTLNRTIVPFLNAQVQGFCKIYRTIVSNKSIKGFASLLGRLTLFGIIPALANFIMYDDDDDYQALSDYYKDNFYLFKIGKNFVKIPKGRVLSIFSTAITRTIEYERGDTKAFDGYIEQSWQNLSPVNDFRTIFSPIADVKTNTTWYGGTLESSKYQNLKPSNRYDNDTSWFGKKIGKLLNVSPIKVDYLLDQYTGVVGDILIPATSNNSKTNAFSFVKSNLIVDTTYKNKYCADFNDYFLELQYLKSDGDAIATLQLKYMNKVKTSISDLYKQQQELESNSSISIEDKKAQLDVLQITINNLYKSGLYNTKQLGLNLQNYQLSDLSIDDDYRNALCQTFGSEYALSLTSSSIYKKASLLQDVGISYDTFYSVYYSFKNSNLDANMVFRYINQIPNLNYYQKCILLKSCGYSLNSNMQKRLKLYSQKFKTSKKELYELISSYAS